MSRWLGSVEGLEGESRGAEGGGVSASSSMGEAGKKTNSGAEVESDDEMGPEGLGGVVKEKGG